MFEPPVATSFTTAVRSNGLPATGLAGDAATSDTTGACTSVRVAVKGANGLLPDTTDKEREPTGWSVPTGAVHEASTSSPAIRASEERRITPPAGRGE